MRRAIRENNLEIGNQNKTKLRAKRPMLIIPRLNVSGIENIL
jgi:hypothetical protein